MSLETLATYATACTVLIGFLTLLYNRFVKPVHKIAEAAAEIINYQLSSNGGGSLTDKMDKLGTEVPALRTELAEVKSVVLRIESMTKEVVDERTNSHQR